MFKRQQIGHVNYIADCNFSETLHITISKHEHTCTYAKNELAIVNFNNRLSTILEINTLLPNEI